MNMKDPHYPIQTISADQLGYVQQLLGAEFQRDVELSRYTTARVGGPAAGFIQAKSASRLEEIVVTLWSMNAPFVLLGGGSNVLISDKGLPLIVILNRCNPGEGFRIMADSNNPRVEAESGVNLSNLARKVGEAGLSGLEWAGGIPGTVGGGVVGNAGAHGSNMEASLLMADILQQNLQEPSMPAMRMQLPPDALEYGYRQSRLKSLHGKAIVLAAQFKVFKSKPELVNKLMEDYGRTRQKTQPKGASMGSIFKNPEGDYAGRLIEEAGLKGACIGGAEISRLHGNFFINRGNAHADEILQLIMMAKEKVMSVSGVDLKLEIELLGFSESTV